MKTDDLMRDIQRKDLLKDKKLLEETLFLTMKGMEGSLSLIYLLAFILKIKPVADRYGWTVEWGMGSLSFINKKGEHLYEDDSKAVAKVTKEIHDLFENFCVPEHNCGRLWDISCSLGDYDCYNKEKGFHKFKPRTSVF